MGSTTVKTESSSRVDDDGNTITTYRETSNYTGIFGFEHTVSDTTTTTEGPSGYEVDHTLTHRSDGGIFGATTTTENYAYGTNADGVQWSRHTIKDEVDD